MKKIYLKPETEVIAYRYQESLLQTASPVSMRNVGGGPTEADGKTIPGIVGETDADTDPYAGHGQGSGGAGNRAKGFGAWDEWDF